MFLIQPFKLIIVGRHIASSVTVILAAVIHRPTGDIIIIFKDVSWPNAHVTLTPFWEIDYTLAYTSDVTGLLYFRKYSPEAG